MNTSKTVLFAIGAIIMTTGTAFEASARAYEGSSAQTPSVQRLLGGQASINFQPQAGAQVALNPQPLPPLEHDDYDGHD